MRGLLTVVTLLLVATLGVSALILLASGRSFVYSTGIGANVRLTSLLPWLALTFVATGGIGALLHGSARAFPKKYFQLVWWRDVTWVVAMLAALGAGLTYFGALLTYGAR